MKERWAEIGSALPENLDSLPRLKGFRLRGMEMTRLETFIDAAFAFAISMPPGTPGCYRGSVGRRYP
jgi:hypothetical protein